MAITHLDCVQVTTLAPELETTTRAWQALLGRSAAPCRGGARIGLRNSALEIVSAERSGRLSLAFAAEAGVAPPALPARGVPAAIRSSAGAARASSRVAAEAASAVCALDHVVVRSDDLDACLEGYRAAGLRLALDRTFSERGVRLVFFRFGQVTLELSGAHPPPKNVSGTDQLWGLAWRVPSIDAARARLEASGFETSEFRAGNKAGTRVFTLLEAPSGVPTLILEDPSRNDPIE